MGNSVTTVVTEGLCLSCGTCVAVCPEGAIDMQETPGGLLVARVNEALCNQCGLCRKACPGLGIDMARFLPSGADPFRGPVLEACSVQATDPELLRGAQSGGLVSALLLHLLDSGEIDGALLTRMPADGRLRPEVFVADSPEGVLSARGSKYCPVALNAALGLLKPRRSVAVVGLGCHVHGLYKAMDALPWLRDRVRLTIGLFCNRTLSYRAIDYLVQDAHMGDDGVRVLLYKSKKPAGWPGDVLVVGASGREYVIPRSRLGMIWAAFTPSRCLLCLDKHNALCDLAVGDAWGLPPDPRGLSVALLRTERGRQALNSAAAARGLEISSIPPEVVLARSNTIQRWEEWATFMQLAHVRGNPAPSFGLDESQAPSVQPAVKASGPHRLRLSEALRHDSSAAACLRRVRRYLLLQRLKQRLSRLASLPVRILRKALSMCGLKRRRRRGGCEHV